MAETKVATVISLTEALLAADAGKLLQKKTKVLEIKRLSEALGQPFEMKLQPISPERYNEISMSGVILSEYGTLEGTDTYNMQVLQVLEGVKYPDFSDKNLCQHFKAETPKELVSKLFLAGEIDKISKEITELSGYTKDKKKKEIETVKN
ncbi:MAG: hypothetical protein SOY76_02995 [Veillonella caviae]|nr:hypothetical protein [Veillonella caviae]